MERDFITHRMFLPLTQILYNWTGIVVSPFALLVITVIALTIAVIYIMKNS